MKLSDLFTDFVVEIEGSGLPLLPIVSIRTSGGQSVLSVKAPERIGPLAEFQEGKVYSGEKPVDVPQYKEFFWSFGEHRAPTSISPVNQKILSALKEAGVIDSTDGIRSLNLTLSMSELPVVKTERIIKPKESKKPPGTNVG